MSCLITYLVHRRSLFLFIVLLQNKSTSDFVKKVKIFFSKVPKLFGRIWGDIILFESSKRRRLEPQNFVAIVIFIPFTTYGKTNFTE